MNNNKNEILIGRQVDKGDFQVDEQYKAVGRKHARIIRKHDGLYLEDLDSSNGTFVNGKSIKIKRVNTNDRIFLGGVSHYELNLDKVISLMPMSDDELRQGFLYLKEVYDNYQTDSSNQQTKGQEDMMTKRMLPTMLMGVVTTILTVIVSGGDEKSNAPMIIGVLGAILTVFVFIIATKMASRSSRIMKERLNQLNEDFELEYVCPACGFSLKGKSWEFLNKQGKCMACKREWSV